MSFCRTFARLLYQFLSADNTLSREGLTRRSWCAAVPAAPSTFVAFIDDVCEDCDTSDLISWITSLESQLDELPGTGHLCQTLATVTELTPIVLMDSDIKWFLTSINKMPKGNECSLGGTYNHPNWQRPDYKEFVRLA